MPEHAHHVCPVSKAGKLDSKLRKITHSPKRLFGKYIKPGMVVLDFGCGPGFFSIELTKMVEDGKVIAADLQEEMLDKLKAKNPPSNLILHKTRKDSIDIEEKVDFILAFYVVHETPDIQRLLNEFYNILKEDGRLFISEPTFHVSKKEFDSTVQMAVKAGFQVVERPKVTFARSIVLRKDGS